MSEIGEFEIKIFGYKNVFHFQIQMHDFFFVMQIGHGINNLAKDGSADCL